jgi:hypothetical protein
VIRRGLLVALLAASGCVDDFEPDVGAPLRPACSDEDSDPEVRVSFADDIQTGIFERADLGCADCHTTEGPGPIGLRASGLNLATLESLLRGGDESGPDIVVPGSPCRSILVQKVGPAPPFGGRMPLDGPPYLDDEQVRLVSDWIAEGADAD